jgi:CheY-like chemotaxis protein
MQHALIIEDREVIALMIQDELAELGFASAAIASSQYEAIQLAERRYPDLITVDDGLSSGSGIEAVRHICRHQAIPVVFITGDAKTVTDTVAEAIILEKPFTHAALAEAVRLATEGARTYSYVHVL